MRINGEKGAFVEGLLTLFAISIVIFAILLPREARIGLNQWPGALPVQTTNGDPAYVSSGGLPSGSVYVNTGNARYTSDPMDEYVIIENRGLNSINITGWRLENGKSDRSYAVGSNYVQYASDTGVIPQGVKVLSPQGRNFLEAIVLKPNERAVIISGGPGNLTSFPVVSFKENSCTGYLAEDYRFSSGIEKSCVRPHQTSGVSNLDSACKRYIDSMRSCHKPKFDGFKSNGERCDGCVDGFEGLTSMCVNFIKTNYNYGGCIANHQSDSDFEGKTWHVYLHRPWEMWATEDETLSLYDSQGNLVYQTSY